MQPAPLPLGFYDNYVTCKNFAQGRKTHVYILACSSVTLVDVHASIKVAGNNED